MAMGSAWMYIDDVSVRACFPSASTVAAPVVATGRFQPKFRLLISVSSHVMPAAEAQVQGSAVPMVEPNQAVIEVPCHWRSHSDRTAQHSCSRSCTAADSRMAPNVMADVVVTPRPKPQAFGATLGFIHLRNTASVESTTTSSVGLNRLGTVAVLPAFW